MKRRQLRKRSKLYGRMKRAEKAMTVDPVKANIQKTLQFVEASMRDALTSFVGELDDLTTRAKVTAAALAQMGRILEAKKEVE